MKKSTRYTASVPLVFGEFNSLHPWEVLLYVEITWCVSYAKVAAHNNPSPLSPLAFANFAVRNTKTLNDFHDDVRERYFDVEAILDTELDVKLRCKHNEGNIMISQSRLLQGRTESELSQSLMETYNTDMCLVIKMILHVYFSDSIVYKCQRKASGGLYANNCTDTVHHEEPEADHKWDLKHEEYQKKFVSVYVDAPQWINRKRTLSDVVDLTEHLTKTKSIGKGRAGFGIIILRRQTNLMVPHRE